MLELCGASSGYPRLPVLFNIDLRIGPGELVTVLGGNGAGKSTLLKTILGDVPVSSGEVVFCGNRVTSWRAHQRVAAWISYSPERRRMFPNLSTRDNLVAGSYGVPIKELDQQLALVSELFPLMAERYGQRAGSLSGGEQQMLAIGRALMPMPRLLMVEELSLGLAPVIVTHLYGALRALCERALAVLVAEQFQRFEEQYSDRWLVLERGSLVAAGGREDLHLLSGNWKR